MEALIKMLRETLADEILSKSEKRNLKDALRNRPLDPDQMNFLRSQVFALASEKATPQNYPFILTWMKETLNALQPKTAELSDAFFSPGDACQLVIIKEINTAISKLNVCVFTISDNQITHALLTAKQRGVQVRIITDNDKSLDEGSDVEQLARAGLEVHMDTSTNHMHHKFMLSDNQVLITGSYNWTRSAALYNQENILRTREAGVIHTFSKQFEQLWKVTEEFTKI